MAKMLGGTLTTRIVGEIERQGGFHPNHYGFVKGKPTIEAMAAVKRWAKEANARTAAVIVALNIMNFFNTLPWIVARRETARRQK